MRATRKGRIAAGVQAQKEAEVPKREALHLPYPTSQLPVQIRGEGEGVPDESGRSLIGEVAEAIYAPESAKNALAFHKEGLAGH